METKWPSISVLSPTLPGVGGDLYHLFFKGHTNYFLQCPSLDTPNTLGQCGDLYSITITKSPLVGSITISDKRCTNPDLCMGGGSGA